MQVPTFERHRNICMLSRRATSTLFRFSTFSPRTRAITATSLLALSLTVYTSSYTNPFTLPVGSASSTRAMSSANFPKGKSEEEWRAQLTPEQFRILRKKGTEMAGTGELDDHFAKEGVYECAGCGTPLYTAETKFNSGCGWPAFFDAIPGAVTQHEDTTFGMKRIEITCTNCGGHLGHLFKGEGYKTPTNERACVNSVSIKFNPDKEVEAAVKANAKA